MILKLVCDVVTDEEQTEFRLRRRVFLGETVAGLREEESLRLISRAMWTDSEEAHAARRHYEEEHLADDAQEIVSAAGIEGVCLGGYSADVSDEELQEHCTAGMAMLQGKVGEAN